MTPMASRRTFLKGATLSTALAALGDTRALFAESLSQLPWAQRPQGLPSSDDYLLAPGVRYLNHGSIGTIPRIVHEAHVRYLGLCETNPWLYMWDEPWREPREDVRGRAARVLGCDTDEVAITHNTTEGFNLLAQGLPLEPGDEVLFSNLNHPGASTPWLHHAPARGYTVRRFHIPLGEVPGLTESDVVELHLREITDRTRVLVLPHLDNLVGLRHPLAALVREAKARGVEWVAADGAQTVCMLPVDVKAAGLDFYAASPHKWVQSPKGLGLFYARRELQAHLHPMWVSSGRAAAVGTVRQFEDYGTRNLPEVLALGDALAFQERVGPAEREAHHRQVWQRFRDAVETTPGFTWRSPTRWDVSGALYLVETDGISSGAMFQRLYGEHGIVFRAFQTPDVDAARISPNLQTPFEDLEAFLRYARG
ncbi:MAG: aminotransferase class V-fold PLP-dependent enzyme [Gemmatimonadota bacterium]